MRTFTKTSYDYKGFKLATFQTEKSSVARSEYSEENSRAYLDLILKTNNGTNFRLGGWSFGGVIAFKIAAQLKEMSHEPNPLLLIDTPDSQEIRRWFKATYSYKPGCTEIDIIQYKAASADKLGKLINTLPAH
jgi:thioesterase domain-containing protein